MGSGPIFGIGLTRTGTTTFGDACEILGFTRRSWDTTKSVARSSHGLLVKGWLCGDIERLYEVADSYEVLEDLPWCLVYKEMAERFPDAKFVLTRRKSAERWFQSQVKHTRANEPYWVYGTIFGDVLAENDPEGYMSTYRNHLRDVRAFFAGSDRFLEVCWECGDGWPELCGFLGVPAPEVPFPWSNASPRSRSRLRLSLSRRGRARLRR